MAEITLDEAKKEAASLRKQLNEWAEAYYSKDAPEVEDNVYDQSYNRLLELEKEFPEIVTPDSITQRVGGQIDSDFTKVEHPIPMLSMGDVFSKAELKDFDQRMQKVVGHPVELPRSVNLVPLFILGLIRLNKLLVSTKQFKKCMI